VTLRALPILNYPAKIALGFLAHLLIGSKFLFGKETGFDALGKVNFQLSI
jgi:hypothetical protein